MRQSRVRYFSAKSGLKISSLQITPMHEQAGNFIALPVKVLYLGRLLWAHKVILVQRLHPFFHLCSEIKISIIFRSVSNKRSSSIGSFSSNSHIFETSKTFIDTKLKFQKSTIFTSFLPAFFPFLNLPIMLEFLLYYFLFLLHLRLLLKFRTPP